MLNQFLPMLGSAVVAHVSPNLLKRIAYLLAIIHFLRDAMEYIS